MTNLDIRMAAKSAGVTQWQIADELGVCEMTVSRWYRYELPQEKKKQILAAIEKIKEARRNG